MHDDPTLSREERLALEVAFSQGALNAQLELETWKRVKPTAFYTPNTDGQLQFHQAQHPVRFLFPGNGWGKSAAMGHEWNAWVTHSNRWQPTPRGRVLGVWFCPQYKQFDIMRPMLVEKCFGSIPKWKVADHVFVWPDGSELHIASHDRDWSYLQGIALDLCLFDEHFPERLWTEMLLRRRGTKRTKFVIAATMTKGMTWEHKHIYTPWLKHHSDRGLIESQAIAQQLHPDIFCWPYGGIASNPSMTSEDVRWYKEAVVYSSDKEKQVRLGGGFQDWSGEAVFDWESLAWMAAQMEKLEVTSPTYMREATPMILTPDEARVLAA